MPLGGGHADQRRYIKAVNFGLIYGMGAFGLAQQLGIERGAAQQFIDKYFQRYPGVAAYMRANARVRARARLRRDGVRPAAVAARHQGRRRAAARRRRARGDQRADAGHGRRSRQARDDRGARLDSSANGSRTKLVLQVHDELVLEVPEAELARVRQRAAAADDGRRRAFACRWSSTSAPAPTGSRRTRRRASLRGRAEDVLVARVDAGGEHRTEHEPAEAERDRRDDREHDADRP